MDLKTLSQRTGIKDRVLRYVLENNMVPGVVATPGRGVARDLEDEHVFPVSLAAILHEHGIRGPAVQEIIKRTKSQLLDGKTQLQIDFRGDTPVKVVIDIARLKLKLGLGHHG